MWLLCIAQAGTRSDQLSVLGVELEAQVEAAADDPDLAAALAAYRLAVLDPEGALEAASWAPEHPQVQEVARRAREMTSPEREGRWLTSTNRFCIDALRQKMVNEVFSRCVHADFETELLENLEADNDTLRQGLVFGVGKRVLGQVEGLQVAGETVLVLHRVELTASGIEGELAICPDGCSDLEVGLAWNGLNDEDRDQLLGRSLWAVTRFDLELLDGLVADLRIQGVGLREGLGESLRRELVEEEQYPGAEPQQASGPEPQVMAPDAPGGGPATGSASTWLTWLAALVGVFSVGALAWNSRMPADAKSEESAGAEQDD